MEVKKILFGLVVFALAFCGECFQWTDSLRDSAFVAACVHGNLSLPWTFTLHSGETVQDIKWNFRSENGQQELVAMYIGGTFVALPAFSQRVEYLPNGGLLLNHPAEEDVGNYSITVSVRNANDVISEHIRTATAAVTGGLHVRQEPNPVYNPETNSWHVTLSCGLVVNPGGSPQQGMWKTPQGLVPSTAFQNNHFYLQLENPVQGGNYTCVLLEAKICQPSDIKSEPTVYVNAILSRLSLLEAENDRLRDLNANVTQMSGISAEVDSRLSALESETASLREKASQKVSFYAELHHPYNNQFAGGTAVILRNVYSNEGGAYNASTGDFIAPYSGLYFFAARAGHDKSSNQSASFYLSVNYFTPGKICFASAPPGGSMTCSMSYHLNAGDRVFLLSSGTSTFSRWATFFTGFLISSDD